MKSSNVILAVVLSSLGSLFAQPLTCPDPMKKINEKALCEYLLGIQDSDYVTIQVYLPIKPDSDPQRKDTAYWNQLAEWSRLLFITYDLRNYYDQNQRLGPPPSKDSVSWVYKLMRATKKTILTMREASYITTINGDAPMGLGTKQRRHAPYGQFLQGSTGFDARGRRIPDLGGSPDPVFFEP